MKAIIFGVSGQDGSYLAKLLIQKGYTIFGVSRSALNINFVNHLKLGIQDQINYFSVALNDYDSVFGLIMKIQPSEIYNLAGQSSVAISFKQPLETIESISFVTLNILESIRMSQLPIKFYSAGSSECFGNISSAVNEETPFRPRSPYGVAKAACYLEVANYREVYKIFSCTGILFNHESPLRKENFVAKKIVSTACRIACGSNEKLSLGNINIIRDWGWAPEYVESMWLMLQQNYADDFIIATGQAMSLKQFIIYVFDCFNFDWEEYVVFEDSLMRSEDVISIFADTSKAKNKLNWHAKIKGEILIEKMIECEMNLLYE
jgi:GDPmannose 4,6-dehydratase